MWQLLLEEQYTFPMSCRGGGTRTPGLLVPNQARYQLRHTPEKKTLSACGLNETLCCTASRCNVSLVEVAHFYTVSKKNAIALPIEPVRQNHFARGARSNDPVVGAHIDNGNNLVSIA